MNLKSLLTKAGENAYLALNAVLMLYVGMIILTGPIVSLFDALPTIMAFVREAFMRPEIAFLGGVGIISMLFCALKAPPRVVLDAMIGLAATAFLFVGIVSPMYDALSGAIETARRVMLEDILWFFSLASCIAAVAFVRVLCRPEPSLSLT